MWQDRVCLTDVTLRDGVQSEKKLVSLEDKKRLLQGLIQAGHKKIQVTSFVHPKKVPQMADARELVESLPSRKDVSFSALVLNQKGLERALDAGIEAVDLSMSMSATHSQKNTGLTLLEAKKATEKMVTLAKKEGLYVRAGLQCVFGCYFEGAILEERVILQSVDLCQMGVDEICFADSTGQAVPMQIRELLSKAKERVLKPLSLHLHDTRGLGLVNMLEAFQMGVRRFDTALGGLGGCPFIPGAGGNIATHDACHLFHRMGVATGIEQDILVPFTLELEERLGKSLPGKMHHILASYKEKGAHLS